MARKKKTDDDYKKEIKDLKKENKDLEKENKDLKKDDISVLLDDKIININGYEFPLHPLLAELFPISNTKKKNSEIITTALNVGLVAKKVGRIGKSMEIFIDKLEGDFGMISDYTQIIQGKFELDNKYKTDLEIDVRIALEECNNKMGWNDAICNSGTGTGEEGLSDTNRTGDALVTVANEDGKTTNLGIEVKMAKDYGLGKLDSKQNRTSSIRPETDSAIQQILETNAQNNTELTIFVIDGGDLDPLPKLNDITYYPRERGFIVKVYVMDRNYNNLHIAYEIAREMVLNERTIEGRIDPAMLMFLVEHLAQLTKRHIHLKDKGAELVKGMKKSHASIISDVQGTLIHIDGEMAAMGDLMVFTKTCMQNLMKTGTLTAIEAFKLYQPNDANTILNATKIQLKSYYDSKGLEDPFSEKPETKSEAEQASSNIEEQSKSSNDLDAMTVAELKALCKESGLPVGGKKADLIERLS
jgi:hypothetical protein